MNFKIKVIKTRMSFENIKLAKIKKSFALVDTENQNKYMRVASDRLYMPFSVSAYENKYSSFKDYSIACYVTEKDEEVLTELDEKIKDLVDNSEIFDSSNNEYKSLLKQNRDFPKLFNLKLPRDKHGNFAIVKDGPDGVSKSHAIVVYDENKVKIKLTVDNIEEIFCKKRMFKCIFENAKIYEYNSVIGTTWNLVQMKYCSPASTLEKQVDSDEISCSNDDIDYSKCLLTL